MTSYSRNNAQHIIIIRTIRFYFKMTEGDVATAHTMVARTIVRLVVL